MWIVTYHENEYEYTFEIVEPHPIYRLKELKTSLEVQEYCAEELLIKNISNIEQHL
jgi:hypothetical protein